MYTLRPIFKTLEETPVSTCIYRMTRISDRFHTDSGAVSNTMSSERPTDAELQHFDDGIEDLEKRWTNINSRLQQLQTDIANFKRGSQTQAVTNQVMMPTTVTIQQLTTNQEVIVNRISDLMSSLAHLKSRLASLEDPQNTLSTGGLQEQQKTLLERIKELNDEIKTISATLNNNNNNDQSHVNGNHECCHSEGLANVVPREFQDVVIRAHPTRPPHSLLLLMKQLQSVGVRVYASTHIHSNASDFDKIDDLRGFLPSDPNLQRSQAHMALTLIWSQGPTVEASLMLSPSWQAVPIDGEANVARYLARLVPGLLYETGDVKRTAKLDQFLDLTDPTSPLGSAGCKRDRPVALQLIEKTLANGMALDGSQDIGLADAVVYSAIINAQIDLNKEVGPNTRAWIERCRSAAVNGAPKAKPHETSLTSPVAIQATAAAATDSSNGERAKLEKFLDQLGIVYRTLKHPAVFTVAAMMEHVTSLPGFYVKNLFVKDKKTSKLYLISARHDATVSLNQVAKAVAAKELRFASEDILFDCLGVRQGSVTPLALINDHQRHRVDFAVDGALLSNEEDRLNFHPMTNEATTNLSVRDFKRFLDATGHKPIIIHL